MKNSDYNYREYENDLSAINRNASVSPEGFIQQVEKEYRESLEQAACFLERRTGDIRIVMLAGPSSSGKTTTARNLMEILRQMGLYSIDVSLDDFYKTRENSPVLPDGRPDFESPEALDIPQIDRCLLDLMQHHRSDLPIFDFSTHMPSVKRRHIELPEHSVVIVEGLHALNPIITRDLPEDSLLRVYLSVKQGIQDGEREVLSPNDMRFLRRLVRDYQFRDCPAQKTLDFWPDVMAGEYKYIKPFRPIADLNINTFHSYEISVLREPALALLNQLGEKQEENDWLSSIKEVLEKVHPLSRNLIPEDSILKEFIG